jgi:hypothetical protein
MDDLFLLAVSADNGLDAIWLLQLWLVHIDRPHQNPASPESARQSRAAREAFQNRSNLAKGGRRAFLFQFGQSYREEAFGEPSAGRRGMIASKVPCPRTIKRLVGETVLVEADVFADVNDLTGQEGIANVADEAGQESSLARLRGAYPMHDEVYTDSGELV